jgi:hypothetical protein
VEDAPRSNLKPSRRIFWILPAIALVAVGIYAVLRYRSRTETRPPSAEAVVAQPAGDAATPPPVAAPPAEPPATAAEAPALLERASQHPLFRKGLQAADLIRRWAVLTENLAEGTSPRRELGFLDPHAPFSVVRRGDALVIAPDSYARYDLFGDAIASVDARAAATAYRRLHAVLDGAYRALGFPPGALDRATARALRRLADAPVAADDVAVVQEEGLFAFADARLEQLPDVEKHLLRMGPRNERLIQAKARELLAELKLPVVASKP